MIRVIILVNLLDLIATIYFDKTIGIAEQNPIAYIILNTFGYIGVSIFKLSIIMFSCIVLEIARRKNKLCALTTTIVWGINVFILVWWAAFCGAIL